MAKRKRGRPKGTNKVLKVHLPVDQGWVEVDISTGKLPNTIMKIDLLDWARIKQMGGGRVYAFKPGKYGTTYAGCTLNGKQTLVHRLLLPEAEETDHVDNNGLNNRRSNLRVVTHRQNLCNMKRQTSSRFPGVHWSKRKDCWQARIMYEGKRYHLGYFDDELEAAQAYIDAVHDIQEETLEEAYPEHEGVE